MAGAVGLAGMAALRSGAGLVKLAVGKSCQPTVAGYEPSYMTVALPEDDQGRIAAPAAEEILAMAQQHQAVALGPGLSRSQDLDALVLKLYRQIPCPLVLDADALNALAEQPDWGHAAAARILTPHPGEFGRLANKSVREVQANREAEAQRLAHDRGVIVILKGNATCISDGNQLTVNPTGNPGMASGGSGDVLTGLLAGILAQRLDAFAAAQLAVYLHGLAGDIAAQRLGQDSLIASDLINAIPQAMQWLRKSWGT